MALAANAKMAIPQSKGAKLGIPKKSSLRTQYLSHFGKRESMETPQVVLKGASRLFTPQCSYIRDTPLSYTQINYRCEKSTGTF